MRRLSHSVQLFCVILATSLLCRAALGQTATSVAAIASELRQGQPRQALRDADAATRANSRDPRLWTVKGLAARELNDTKSAMAAFEAALRTRQP